MAEPHAIHRYDHEMLVTLRLAAAEEPAPPMLHLRRQGSGGLFDRLARHYDSLWRTDGQPITTAHDLEQHILEEGGTRAASDERGGDRPRPERARSLTRSEEPAPGSGRRWPRRPK